MRTIYKYPINLRESEITVPLPLGAQVLSVGQDTTLPGGNGRLVLWAVVETYSAIIQEEKITVVGTGHELPPYTETATKFVGTVQDGPLVWHVFVPRSLRSADYI